MPNIIQSNLNHCWKAHDMLKQFMLERDIAVGIISEPRWIPESPNWSGSKDGRAAINWNPKLMAKRGKVAFRGNSCVAVSFAQLVIVSGYISPNCTRKEFLEHLDELDEVIDQMRGHPMLIGGDFNSKSKLWGSNKTDGRGSLVEEWAAQNELRLINVGNEPTCVRAQGASCVDLTWATPDLLGELRGWRVLPDETLSDHAYIYMEIGPKVGKVRRKATRLAWKWDLADRDLFQSSMILQCATAEFCNGEMPLNKIAEILVSAFKHSCDLAAPRRRPLPIRKACHWWTDEIAGLRREAMNKRKQWQHARRRRFCSIEELNELANNYRAAKKALRKEIGRAKRVAWQELINTVESDPWGMPYRLVLKKLQGGNDSLTIGLEREVLEPLLDSLFPNGEAFMDGDGGDTVAVAEEEQERPEIQCATTVTTLEVVKMIRRPKAGNVAPGRDGITGAILKTLPSEAVEVLASLYSRCLQEGVFPAIWKIAILVLIPKPGSEMGSVPKVRPICLLSELGKILERIIAERLKAWMADNPEYRLAETQFGFRDGKSTCDALNLVKRVVKTETDDGGYTIAVSIDIKNAFNSIPWNRIGMALSEKGFPIYLVKIIGDYLSCRAIEYPVADGGCGSRPVRAGVPQGSVLGPLLWNIAFDSVLYRGTEPGCLTVCYADDTLVLASADTVNGAAARANLQVGLVIGRIRRLGLKVAVDKTEVVLFHGKRRGPRKDDFPHIQVGTEWIKAGTTMKYLGVILDSRLKFVEHFKYAALKATKITRALCRLMPNLRGPTEAKRRLYAEVVLSVILYGAPIWSEELEASRDALRDLDQVMRVMAIRVIAGYRTVSLDAAGVLGRIPPLRILARARKRMYERVRNLKEADNWSKELDAAIRKKETLLMRRQWELYLQRHNAAGKYTRDALLPNIFQWLSREHNGGMTFRLSQLLTGHGSFAVYLFRIGKVDDPRCAHCNTGEEDSALHTLARCEAWEADRIALREAIGQDLSLVAVIAAMCRSAKEWTEVARFAESVMLKKETLERDRRAAEAARVASLPTTSEDSVTHSDVGE